MAANTLTLRLDDGTDIVAMVVSDIEAPLAELLASGDELRLRADDLDVSGHAMADTVSVWVAGPDDVSGHALALRLPSAQAARAFQLKLIAGGAIAVVLATGAIVSQAAPIGIPGEAGSVIGTQASEPASIRHEMRTAPAEPAQVRHDMRTDAAAPVTAPAAPVTDDDRQIIHRGSDKSLPGV
ncbi:MAG TPA: hypothetical protein VJZ72_06720 [Candidatus Limnocylindrales bacterium]|nr:hypothetical protein [Candidatus Limnocylindrales bacterium]